MSFLNLCLAEAGLTDVAMNERRPSPHNEPQITELTEEEAKQEVIHYNGFFLVTLCMCLIVI